MGRGYMKPHLRSLPASSFTMSVNQKTLTILSTAPTQNDTVASTHSDEEEHEESPPKNATPEERHVSPTAERSAILSSPPPLDPEMDAVTPTHPNEGSPPFDATPNGRHVSPSSSEASTSADDSLANTTPSQSDEEIHREPSSETKNVAAEADATSETPGRVLASITNLNNPASTPVRPRKREREFVYNSEGESEVEEKDSEDEDEVPVRPPDKKRQRVDSSAKRGSRTKTKAHSITAHPLYERYISSLLPLAKGRTGLSLEGRRNKLCEDPLVRKITGDGRVITCDACSEDLVLAGACSFCRWRDHRAICPKGIEWFIARSAEENEKPT